MKVCVNNIYQNNIFKNKNFKQNKKFLTKIIPNKPAKKIFSLGVGLTFLASVLFNCKPAERNSSIADYEGIKVEFYNVKKETQDSLMKPLLDLQSKLQSKNNFLNNIKIDVAKYFTRLKEKDSFTKHLKENVRGSYTKGVSFYSDSKLLKRIALQERSHKKTLENITPIQAMRQSLMHEVGHQFDNYYGHDHNADFALKWDSILQSKTNSPNETPYSFGLNTAQEKQIDKKYTKYGALSDKEEFKTAFLKDLKIIKAFKENHPEELANNISYYIKNMDLDSEISSELVEKADFQRSEVYANLFSYAMGQDEGDKSEFLKSFPNSYEIVKKDISKHLNI